MWTISSAIAAVAMCRAGSRAQTPVSTCEIAELGISNLIHCFTSTFAILASAAVRWLLTYDHLRLTRTNQTQLRHSLSVVRVDTYNLLPPSHSEHSSRRCGIGTSIPRKAFISATTHCTCHTDGMRVATIGIDLALIGSLIARTGRIAFELATCAKRTEAICINDVAAGLRPVVACGCYVTFVHATGAPDAAFACGALDKLARGGSKRILKWGSRRVRSNKRTVFPQEPQLFTLFWVFTHALPHNDGVGDAHAITRRKHSLGNTVIKMDTYDKW